MAVTAPPPPVEQADGPQPSRSGGFGDALFKGLAVASGVLILLVLAGVFLFLLTEGFPALVASPDELPGGRNIGSYLGTLLFGTVLAATLAVLIAAPLSIGIALFISHYAPRRLAAGLGYLVDLLAAVPSVIFGLWGISFLAPRLSEAFPWLERNLGFLPFFEGPINPVGSTMLTVGVVLAVMIMPIMTAVNREVFLQTPKLTEEAALALGATRWEMIKMTVLPFGRSGVISGIMLGLGRALGETIAVALVLSAVPGLVSFNLIGQANSSTVAANIALMFPESSGLAVNALVASGLALFVLTFIVNFIARGIVARRAEFSGANG